MFGVRMHSRNRVSGAVFAKKGFALLLVVLLLHRCLNACKCLYLIRTDTRIGIAENLYNIINAVHRDGVLPLSITAKCEV